MIIEGMKIEMSIDASEAGRFRARRKGGDAVTERSVLRKVEKLCRWSIRIMIQSSRIFTSGLVVLWSTVILEENLKNLPLLLDQNRVRATSA